MLLSERRPDCVLTTVVAHQQHQPEDGDLDQQDQTVPRAGQLRDPAGDRQGMHHLDDQRDHTQLATAEPRDDLIQLNQFLPESEPAKATSPPSHAHVASSVQSRCGDLGNPGGPMALDCATMVPAMKTTSVGARARRHPTTESLMMSGRKKTAAIRAASLANWAAPPSVTMSPSSRPPKIS